MSLPSVEEAKTWVGSNVRDRDGADLGRCVKIYADDATGVLEWLAVSVSDGRNAVVPAGGATGTGDGVQVSYTSEQVRSAPAAESLEHVQTAEEAALYEHYGVPYSSAESPTLLPADAADTVDSVDSTAPEPVTAPVPDRDTAEVPVTPVAAAVPDPEPVYDVSPPTTVSGGSRSAFGPAASASRAPVAAVAAAGGLATAAVLLRRLLPRRRQQPLARTTRSRKVALSRAETAGRRRSVQASRSAATGVEVMRRVGVRAKDTAVPVGSRAARSASESVSQAGRTAVQNALTATAAAAQASKRSAGQARQVGSQVAGSADQVAQGVLSAARRTGTGTARAVTGTVTPVTDAAATVVHTGRTTMGLIKNAVILGAGYVLGTRAGRERYEQIQSKAQQIWQRPQVQQATQKVKGTVRTRLPGGGTSAYDDVATYPATPPVVTSGTLDPYATTGAASDLPEDPTFPTTPRP